MDDVLAHAPGPATDSVSYGGGDWGFDRHEVRVQGTYEALVGAFSGDPEGPDDIIWYAAGYAADSLWEGRPDRTFAASPFVIDGTFEPHVGDFDGDGWDDVLWYAPGPDRDAIWYGGRSGFASVRSEEHTSELPSLMRISYAVFCLKKKTQTL